MKRILLTMVGCGLAVGTYAQGVVKLENGLGSQYVTLNTANGTLAAAGSYQVALLWYNGTSFQQIGNVYQTTTANGDGAGYFFGEVVTVPTYTATGTFIVEGWTGNYANYAAALAAGGTEHVGQTASFANPEGNVNGVGGVPFDLCGGTPPVGPGNWNGQLILTPAVGTPEPSTIALGCLGAAVIWLFRRRK